MTERRAVLEIWVVVDDQNEVTSWGKSWNDAARIAMQQLVEQTKDTFTAGEGTRRVVRMVPDDRSADALSRTVRPEEV